MIDSAPIPHGKHIEVHSVDRRDRLQRQKDGLERGDDVDQLAIAHAIGDLHLVMQIVVDLGALFDIPSNLPITTRQSKAKRW